MFVRRMCAVFLYLVFTIEEILCQGSDCTTPDGSRGVCVQIEECQFVLNIVHSSPRPLPRHVVNTLNTYTCDWNKGKPKVCCNDTTDSRSNVPIVASTIEPTTEQPEDVSTHRNLNLLPLNNCGSISEVKISNGNLTGLFEYPWMALLQYSKLGKLMFSCGGSLISDRYVLTAAHCVTRLPREITLVGVRLGEHNISSDNDCQNFGPTIVCAPQVQDFSIETVIFHPLYDAAKHTNDIAVIRLARAATITGNVQPICLPTTFTAQNTVLRKSEIAGWGNSENGRPSPVLLKAVLPIVSNDNCQTRLNTYQRQVQRQRRIELIQITEKHLCAGGDIGVDSCRGDSGGPLMYPNNGNMVQFGIVSFGVDGCSGVHDYPGVYVRVAYYMRWLLDQLKL